VDELNAAWKWSVAAAQVYNNEDSVADATTHKLRMKLLERYGHDRNCYQVEVVQEAMLCMHEELTGGSTNLETR
jgi:hypothetical protein